MASNYQFNRNKFFIYPIVSSSGGGGSDILTVDNYLTENPANNAQFGGTGIQDTTADQQDFNLNFANGHMVWRGDNAGVGVPVLSTSIPIMWWNYIQGSMNGGIQGVPNWSPGLYSISWGDVANANGQSSAAFGDTVTANGLGSFVSGRFAIAGGEAAAAFGNSLASGDSSFAVIDGNAIGDRAFSAGENAFSRQNENYSFGRNVEVDAQLGSMVFGSGLTTGGTGDRLTNTRGGILFGVNTGVTAADIRGDFTIFEDGVGCGDFTAKDPQAKLDVDPNSLNKDAVTATNASVYIRNSTVLPNPLFDGQLWYQNLRLQHRTNGVTEEIAYLSDIPASSTPTPVVETINLGDTNAQITLNNGTFTGIYKPLQYGNYDNFDVVVSQNTLSATTVNLRVAIYDGAFDLIEEGVLTGFTGADGTGVKSIPLNSTVSIPTTGEYVYIVVGFNDASGGGNISVRGQSATNLNEADISFSFSDATGTLPANISAGRSVLNDTVYSSINSI